MTRQPHRLIDLDLSKLLGVRVAQDQSASLGRTETIGNKSRTRNSVMVGTKPTRPVMVGTKPTRSVMVGTKPV
ncbi:MAG: hypothetical protein Q8S29_11470 [Phreatobacter sp.]|nr:hypothetical protein [Phreatobacter sp.]